MIAFLKTGTLATPRLVSAPPAKDVGGAGVIVPNFSEGTLLLRNKDGQYLRLAWQKEPPADRRRALPAGDYTLTNYTIVRRDDKGKEWFISATGKMIRRITVKEGEKQVVNIDDTIGLAARSRRSPGEVRVNMGVHGEHHSGLTLYYEGKRITFGYRLLSSDGSELASGAMEYG